MFQDLNTKWASLQQLTAERATQLGSAHEVQRFHRDVDETKDWIQEKDEALNNDDLGKDLRSVQTLQRKHEGIERDLAALGDKIKQLDETANRLMQTHPESVDRSDHKKSPTVHQRKESSSKRCFFSEGKASFDFLCSLLYCPLLVHRETK